MISDQPEFFFGLNQNFWDRKKTKLCIEMSFLVNSKKIGPVQNHFEHRFGQDASTFIFQTDFQILNGIYTISTDIIL